MAPDEPHGSSINTVQLADIITSSLGAVFDRFLDRQAKRDKLWQAEQAEHDKLRQAEQAERDKLWQAEQAERDHRQTDVLAKIMEALGSSSQPTAQAASPDSGLRSRSQYTGQHAGTPQVRAQKPSKFTKEAYEALSRQHADLISETELSHALRMLPGKFGEAWDKASEDKNLRQSQGINQILAKYCASCAGIRRVLQANTVSEPIYQEAFDALARVVDEYISTTTAHPQGMRWEDTHNRKISRGDGPDRMPDGSLFMAGSTVDAWHNMVAIVEIKGSTEPNPSHHLRGQIIQGLIDMAERRPRRFAFAMTLAHQHDVGVGVPYVPLLLYAAAIENNNSDTSEIKGEILVVEHAGRGIRRFFEDPHTSEAQIVDIFTAYFHTLLSAAER
ncbi:hypothetical protein IWW54_000715 [Coemansia sp. RSA 2705]|nr:hypothetical protein IWW54_000715 [Coemansia sp. RSA 2705]